MAAFCRLSHVAKFSLSPAFWFLPFQAAGVEVSVIATSQALNRPSTHCNSEDFEIAASEFDALTGSLLRVRNVTAVHAKRLTAVKATSSFFFGGERWRLRGGIGGGGGGRGE